MKRWHSLVDSRRLRLTLFTAAYFCQGVPIGLLTIALPAWLSQRGSSLGEIAAYQAIVGLPWGFKLVAGPFMDRFAFLAMGRRRPWIMAAQAGLTLALASLAVVDDPLGQLRRVIALAFLVNAFAALQDVAVDGMAIDVLPEDERGRANAFMAFGQVAGYSSFAALCGALLSRYGLGVAACISALTVGAVFVLVGAVRERAGERLLPWSAGEAARRNVAVETSFAGVFLGLLKVLLLPMSLILAAGEWLVRMRDGVAIAVVPVAATQTLGFSAETYSSFQGIVGVAIAIVGVGIGPLVDRYGAKRFYLLGIGGSALMTLVFALTPTLWSNTAYVVAIAVTAGFFGQIIFISFIACSMTICWLPVAASQFAIYMSLSNLARSLGSSLLAPVADRIDLQQQLLLISALMLCAFVVVSFFDPDRHRARLRALDRTG